MKCSKACNDPDFGYIQCLVKSKIVSDMSYRHKHACQLANTCTLAHTCVLVLRMCTHMQTHVHTQYMHTQYMYSTCTVHVPVICHTIYYKNPFTCRI